MRLHLPCSFAALMLLATLADLAVAQVPKVLSDAPPDKASWRMEVMEMPGRDAKAQQAMGPMTVCTTALQAMSKDKAPGTAANEPKCTSKLLEDSANRATMEVTCTGDDPSKVKSTITRVAPRSYEVASEMSSAKQPQPMLMRMKMSYAGACSAQDAAVKLDGATTAKACANSKMMLAQMDPAKCPKGANNAQCVQQMTSARSQMEAMCK